MYILWHYDCCMLAGLQRHQRRDCNGYEQRLSWCWTEEAAPWITQQLGLLSFRIAGVVLCIAVCWCWQCLLTVGGKWLPHTVTQLDVTTWHDAVDRPRIFYTTHNAGQQHCKHQSNSGPASVFTAWNCTGSFCSLFTENWCLFALKIVYSNKLRSLVPTLCSSRTVMLHKLRQGFVITVVKQGM